MHYTRKFLPLLALLPAAPALAQDDPAPQIHVDDVVTVTSVPYGATSESLTQGVSILDGSLLDQRLEGTIGETLSDLPGISSTFFGPGASRPIVRGQSGPRVRVLVGGIGSIDASTVSPDHAVAGEGLSVEKVEVIRGPSTLLYGPSAIGGVVNILDGRISTAMPENGFEAAGRAWYGTNADERAVAASVTAGIGEHLALHLDGDFRQAGAYHVPRGALDQPDESRVENSGLKTKSGSAGLSYIGESGFFGVSVTGLDSNYGVPGHEHHDEEDAGHGEDEEREEEAVSIDLKQTRVDVMGGLDADFLIFKQTKLRFGWADYQHTEIEGEANGTIFNNTGWEGRLDLVQDDSGPWSGGIGFSIRRRNFEAIGDEAFTPPSVTTEWGLFAAEEYALGAVTLQAGLRYDRTRINPDTPDPTLQFDQVGAALGAIWIVNDALRLTVNLSRTERAPTAEELFSDGPHLATKGYEVGDPTLGEETAHTAEIGVHLHHAPFDLEASFYYTAYSDYIALVTTGAEEDGLPVRLYSPVDATFYGMELEAGVDIADGLRARTQLDWVRATIDATDEPLPRIPPLRLTGGLDYSSDRLDLGAELQYVAAQNRVAAFEEPTGDYVLLNADLTWRPFGNLDGVSVGIRARNLLNKVAYNHSSFIKEDAPLSGRDVRFTLNVAL